MSITILKSAEEFEKVIRSDSLAVIHFEAAWAPQCKQINDCLEELSKLNATKNGLYCSLNAEDFASVSKKYAIAAVPTVLVMRGGSLEGRVEGARPAEVVALVKKLCGDTKAPQTAPSRPVTDEDLKRLTSSHDTMLFMKGDPNNPRCGFSRTTVQLLNELNAEYNTFDILTNEAVRQRLKEYSQWPTYPQLYVKGELVGGLDILKELHAQGELEKMLTIKKSLDCRLKELTNRAPLMLFMKGNRQEPRCGFSKTIIQILNETGLPYDTFDILSDEEVRQGLKTFSNWPTYPQVYVKGELMGGLDIIKEMQQDGSLEEALKG